MLQITDNVRQDLAKLVPASNISDMSCFCFYDNHPRDNKKLDIVISTSRGELKEFFERELVSSVYIGSKVTDMRILRNSKCDLFYLLWGNDELIVMSRRSSLEVLHRLTNIQRYEVEDSVCSGQAYLKVVRNDDAMPLLFDENFENFTDQVIPSHVSCDDSLPVVRELMRKLTEAKYTVQCNKKAYENLLRLRQQASFSAYQMTGPLVLKNRKPWVKLCNGKIIIIMEALRCERLLNDVQILLHGTTRPAISYTTKLFEKLPDSPYWKETSAQSINQNCNCAIVGVIDLKELKYNITSRVMFDAVISYKSGDKEHLLPLKNISISALETLSEKYDVLSDIPKSEEENRQVILALMASTEKIDLCVSHMKNEEDIDIDFLVLFCKHLQMERVMGADNIIVHRNSPFHTLHGVMIQKDESSTNGISVYTRCPSQVVALINYIHDAVPYKIVMTTVDQRIHTKHGTLHEYNREISSAKTNSNYTEYAASILDQTATMLNYLDRCMIKMNESKDPVIRNKVGSEIDVFSDGDDYDAFRKKILEEATRGISSLAKTVEAQQDDIEGMMIDSD